MNMLVLCSDPKFFRISSPANGFSDLAEQLSISVELATVEARRVCPIASVDGSQSRYRVSLSNRFCSAHRKCLEIKWTAHPAKVHRFESQNRIKMEESKN